VPKAISCRCFNGIKGEEPKKDFAVVYKGLLTMLMMAPNIEISK